MKALQQKRAWVWVALATVAIAFAARTQPGSDTADSYPHAIIHFLSGGSSAQRLAGEPRGNESAFTRRVKIASVYGMDSGAWTAQLPVLFIGLVSPLNLVSPGSSLCLGLPPAAPELPASFQRPPPFRLI